MKKIIRHYSTPTPTEFFHDVLSRDIWLQCKYLFATRVGNRLYSIFTNEYLEYDPVLIAYRVKKVQ